MYESNYDFHQRPFVAIPRANWFYQSASVSQTYQSIIGCIQRAAGAAMIVGASGTGKSVLCQVVAHEMRDTFRVVTLDSARLCTRRALLQSILFNLGLPFKDMEEGELRLTLIDHLQPGPNCPNGMLLVVDEAQSLPTRLLEEIRMITNLVRDGQPRVRLVLAGNRTLEERFSQSLLDSFNQRIAFRGYLQPFDRNETAEYIAFQVEKASGRPDNRVFDDSAINAIYDATDGIPRLINQLCDYALVLGVAEGMRVIDANMVGAAWAELQQLPAPWYTTKENEELAASVVEFGELASPSSQSEESTTEIDGDIEAEIAQLNASASELISSDEIAELENATSEEPESDEPYLLAEDKSSSSTIQMPQASQESAESEEVSGGPSAETTSNNGSFSESDEDIENYNLVEEVESRLAADSDSDQGMEESWQNPISNISVEQLVAETPQEPIETAQAYEPTQETAAEAEQEELTEEEILEIRQSLNDPMLSIHQGEMSAIAADQTEETESDPVTENINDDINSITQLMSDSGEIVNLVSVPSPQPQESVEISAGSDDGLAELESTDHLSFSSEIVFSSSFDEVSQQSSIGDVDTSAAEIEGRSDGAIHWENHDSGTSSGTNESPDSTSGWTGEAATGHISENDSAGDLAANNDLPSVEPESVQSSGEILDQFENVIETEEKAEVEMEEQAHEQFDGQTSAEETSTPLAENILQVDAPEYGDSTTELDSFIEDLHPMSDSSHEQPTSPSNVSPSPTFEELKEITPTDLLSMLGISSVEEPVSDATLYAMQSEALNETQESSAVPVPTDAEPQNSSSEMEPPVEFEQPVDPFSEEFADEEVVVAPATTRSNTPSNLAQAQPEANGKPVETAPAEPVETTKSEMVVVGDEPNESETQAPRIMMFPEGSQKTEKPTLGNKVHREDYQTLFTRLRGN